MMLLPLAVAIAIALPTLPPPEHVTRVVIRHEPSDVEHYASWPLAMLYDRNDIGATRITARATIAQIVHALAASNMRVVPGRARLSEQEPYSPKWSIVLLTDDGRRREISADAFGEAGAFDHVPVTFRSLAPELRRLTLEMPWFENRRAYASVLPFECATDRKRRASLTCRHAIGPAEPER